MSCHRSILRKAVAFGCLLTVVLGAGVLGLALGVEYGGHLCEPCRFFGATGYEATGQVGFLIGALLGLLIGVGGVWMRWTRLLRQR